MLWDWSETKRGVMRATNIPRKLGFNNQRDDGLMDKIVSRKNMTKANKRVAGNKGSLGIDGMQVEDLRSYLDKHWTEIKEALLNGEDYPQSVRKVEIPKPNGGVRLLGIPTAIDRLIQQSIHQLLEPIYVPRFSDYRYGFRSGCSTRQAVKRAKSYINWYNT